MGGGKPAAAKASQKEGPLSSEQTGARLRDTHAGPTILSFLLRLPEGVVSANYASETFAREGASSSHICAASLANDPNGLIVGAFKRPYTSLTRGRRKQ